ncbi:MAG: hypothetical protein JJE49_06810 [Peptostreptococcaceae bacterium]|nr:hypothetical protein [Peptostreptococcaceae bacterium]
MKTNKVALTGVLLGLNMIILFGATMLPGIELSLYALSSFVTAIVVMRASPKSATVFYVATVLLGGVLLPNKLAMLPYALFFGYYGIAKYYIEKMPCGKLKDIHKQVLEIICKIAVFGAAFGIGILIFKEGFTSGLSLPDFPVIIICLAAVVIFVMYDYVFTLMLVQLKRFIK